MFYKIVEAVLRLFVKRPAILGFENVDSSRPGIFIANHMGYYGPLKLMLFSGIELRPWVISEVTERDTCGDYLEMDFVRPTLGLKGRFAGFVAGILAPVCVGLMRYVGAVPVYHGEKRIMETFELSSDLLHEGGSLLIFPEFSTVDRKFELGGFQSGFVMTAEVCQKKYGDVVVFYPVYVDKTGNRLVFGEGVVYDVSASLHDERRRISAFLRDRIEGMSRV